MTRVPLYDRLPEIYRIRDEHGQLKDYMAIFEEVFSAIHESVESLYHDLFIETCDDWVIPYIGDLLGTTHLQGDPATLRADVADTIALRRTKGTLAAIELLTFSLTRWGVHARELRKNLVWFQHLNHQRPDAGGDPPHGLGETKEYVYKTGVPARHRPIFGGTAVVRDPALLSLQGTAFDPFAHLPDLRPPAVGSPRYNLPNLAIFLWRLAPYRLSRTRPLSAGIHEVTSTQTGAASHVLRFQVDPLGRPVRLFNKHGYDPGAQPPRITPLDGAPGPLPAPRLSQGTPGGNPDAYLYADLGGLPPKRDRGQHFHIPGDVAFPPLIRFRGANLCAWERGLGRAPVDGEILIDPDIGRLLFGLDADSAMANPLAAHKQLEDALRLTWTYGAVGPVGAHPISRTDASEIWPGVTPEIVKANHDLKDLLEHALSAGATTVIEIRDSLVHRLDLGQVNGSVTIGGKPNLLLKHSLILRAGDGHRPIIELDQPLRFGPLNPADHTVNSALTVRLEGLFLTRSPASATEPLIARAALHRLELLGCTLDPGGHKQLDGTRTGSRAPIVTSIQLDADLGFALPSEKVAFSQTPEIDLQRSVSGPLLIADDFRLQLTESIIDAGDGVGRPAALYAVSDPANPAGGHGPETRFNGITVLGRMRVAALSGKGAIWTQVLDVREHQRGCVKYSYLTGPRRAVPQNLACVFDSHLRFTSEIHGHAAYCQLARESDFSILERGPGNDAMGAFGFLKEAHKWRNLQIRFREFMPLGIRPLLLPAT